MKIEGDDLWVVGSDKSIDSGLELLAIQGFGKISFNGSFAIMLDAHAIAESFQEFLMSLHEIHLKEMFANVVAGAEFESLVEPGNLVGDGLFFNKDRAKTPVGSEGGYGRLIEFALVFPNPEKHVADEGRVDFLIDFECVHGFFYLRGVNTPRR